MSSRHFRTVAAAVVGLLLIPCVIWQLRARVVAASSDEPSPLPLFQWTLGEERTYHFIWDDLQHVRLSLPQSPNGETRLEGTLHLEGDLALQAVVIGPKSTQVSLRLLGLRRHQAVFAGQPMFPDEASVSKALPATAHALLDFDAQGALTQVRLSEEDPELFRYFAHTLASELFPSMLEARRRWSALEVTQTGEAESTFAFEDAKSRTLLRRRNHYTHLRSTTGQPSGTQTLSSFARFERDPDKRLAAVSVDETLEVATPHATPLLSRQLHLRLMFSTRAEKPLPPALAGREDIQKVGAVPVNATLARSLLRGQADGMTLDQVLDTLRGATSAGAIADLTRFAWRATAALQLEPERLPQLALYFRERETQPAMRELTLDLLSGAGTPEAQKQLTALLASTEAHAHAGAYALMVQRAGWVSHPTPETAQFLADLHRSATQAKDVGVERASAYALGALTSHLEATDPVARTNVLILSTDLAQATTPDAKQHALRALGNTNAEEVFGLARPELAAGDAEVRAAAATALRGVPRGEVTDALLGALPREKDRRVQASVLDSLTARKLDAKALQSLSEWVVTGNLASGADTELLELISQNLGAGPSVNRMLQSLSARQDLSSSSRARVIGLMAVTP